MNVSARLLFAVIVLAFPFRRAEAQIGAGLIPVGTQTPQFAPFDPGLAETSPFPLPAVEATPDENEPAARRDFGGFGGGRGKPGYSVTWYPERPVRDQPATLGIVRQSLGVGAPLWRTDAEKVIATVTIQHSQISTSAGLLDTGRPFPGELWNVRFGINYFRRFDNGWFGGLIVQTGSASDRPFHSVRELTASLIGFLELPARNARDAWMLSIFYSPFGNLNFPIPGLAYLYRPSEEFEAQIGIPFRLVWRPTETFSWDVSYVPLTNIATHARWKFHASATAYAGYEFLTDAYFLAERPDRRDRFMAFEQRIFTGVQWEPWRRLVFDVNLGYSFGRSFGEGRNQGGELRDEVHVSPGFFLGADLGWRF